MNEHRIREAADRVERIDVGAPAGADRRYFALAAACDELHVEQCDVIAELVRRREARLGARQ